MKNRLFGIVALMFILGGCYEDKGNYDYTPIKGVDAYLSSKQTNGIYMGVKDTLIYTINWNGVDSTQFDFEWRIDDEIYNGYKYIFTPKETGQFYGIFSIINKKTKVRLSDQFQFSVLSPFHKGWVILADNAGTSELSFVLPGTKTVEGSTVKTFEPTKNLFKQYFESDLGSQPYDIQETMSSTADKAEIYVIQYGGEGSVKLDASSFKPVVYLHEEFLSGAPANLRPKHIGYLAYVEYIWSEDGNLYSRNNPKPDKDFHATRYDSDPVYYPGGLNVSLYVPLPTHYSYHDLIVDSKNNRFLGLFTTSRQADGAGQILELNYTSTVPTGFVDLCNLEGYEVVYTTYKSTGYRSADILNLIKRESDNKYFLQEFTSSVPFGATDVEISNMSQSEFTGSINDRSFFWFVRGRNILMYSGGANNDELYYYNVNTTDAKLFDTLDSSITAMESSQGAAELGVGTANGMLRIYDISATNINNNILQELYREKFDGKIVDVLFKYGRNWFWEDR